MKYKTIIEVVCDGFDEEDASHTAGEYLKGNLESGVYMTCRTVQVSDMGGEKREENNV